MRKATISRLIVATYVTLSLFAFTACDKFSSPQNVFSPAGSVSSKQKHLFFITMWPALVILFIVEFGLIYILFRFRRRKSDTGLPPQVHGNNFIEILWTVAPAILLAFFVVPTVAGIVNLGRTPSNAITVEVNGSQWFWQFAYPSDVGGTPVALAPSEPLHIPLGRNIELKLHSTDVIHSFWVPKLAGKTDVIPGRANHMWLKATETGTFEGQCAEFCGLNHATMRFEVIVESQEDFDAWLRGQAAAQHPDSQPQLAFEGD